MSTPPITPRGNSASHLGPQSLGAPEPQNAGTGQMTTASGTVVPVTHLPPNSGPQIEDFVLPSNPSPLPPPSTRPLRERQVSLGPAPSPSPSPGPAMQIQSPLRDRALKLLVTEDRYAAADILKKLSEEDPGAAAGVFNALVAAEPDKANEVLEVIQRSYPEILDLVSPPPQKADTPAPGLPSSPSPAPEPAHDLPPSVSDTLTRILNSEDVSGAAMHLYIQARINPGHFGQILSKFAEQAPERYIDVRAFVSEQAAMSKDVAWFNDMIAKEAISAVPRPIFKDEDTIAHSALQLFHASFVSAAHVFHRDLEAVVARFNEEHFRPFYVKPLSIEPSADLLHLRDGAERYFRASLDNEVPSGGDPKIVENVMERALASVSCHELPWLQDIAVVTGSLEDIIAELKEKIDGHFPWENLRAATVCVTKAIFSAGFMSFWPAEDRPDMVRVTTAKVLLFLKEMDELHAAPEISRDHPLLPLCENLLLEEFHSMALPPQYAERKNLIDSLLPEGFAPLVFTLDCLDNAAWERLVTDASQALTTFFTPGAAPPPPAALVSNEDAINLVRAVIKSLLPEILQDTNPDATEVNGQVTPQDAAVYSLSNRIENAFYAVQLNGYAADFSEGAKAIATFVVSFDQRIRPKAYEPPK